MISHLAKDPNNCRLPGRIIVANQLWAQSNVMRIFHLAEGILDMVTGTVGVTMGMSRALLKLTSRQPRAFTISILPLSCLRCQHRCPQTPLCRHHLPPETPPPRASSAVSFVTLSGSPHPVWSPGG